MAEKVVVVTGASSGIGAALAIALAKRGDRVVLVARRKEALDGVVAQCGAYASAIVADVTTRAEVQRVVAAALALHGRIDVWVNNVGQGIARLPTQLTDDDIDEMMRVNVKSAMYGMQEVLPTFMQAGAGHVLNVSSMLGRVPYVPIRSAYSAAKHFLNSLTANFRTEVQEKHPGIQFTVITPGPVATDFGANSLHGRPAAVPFPDSQSAEEVAAVIVGAIDSRSPDVYTRDVYHDRVVAYYTTIAGSA